VLFNSPLPFLADEMAGLEPTALSTHDYFFRQGNDADALAAELELPGARRRYIAPFYSSRLWAHPGSFDDATIAFHTEPFEDATKLRASWGCYEAVFRRELRTDRPKLGRNPDVQALLLYGPSDHVISPDWDRMAAVVYPDHVGPFLLRDVGHFLPWEAPARFTGAVTSFCRDLLA
jgi:pimeloyl-ACP methyl ester carboxylesterase